MIGSSLFIPAEKSPVIIKPVREPRGAISPGMAEATPLYSSANQVLATMLIELNVSGEVHAMMKVPAIR